MLSHAGRRRITPASIAGRLCVAISTGPLGMAIGESDLVRNRLEALYCAERMSKESSVSSWVSAMLQERQEVSFYRRLRWLSHLARMHNAGDLAAQSHGCHCNGIQRKG